MAMTISPATEIEKPKINSFISKVGASLKDTESPSIQYLTAKDHELELAAVLGIIREGQTVILRHLIIDPKRCDMAMLLEIMENAVAFAATQKAKQILFLTPAPAELFQPIGFKEADPDSFENRILEHLPQADQLPATAKYLLRQF